MVTSTVLTLQIAKNDRMKISGRAEADVQTEANVD